MESLNVAQGGFRSQRSTLDQIIGLDRVMKKQKRRIVAFLDIAKAYDSVPRSILWSKCKRMKIGNEVIEMLKELFDRNRSRIKVNDKISSRLPHPAGVLQGSILSPLLYSIFINDLPIELSDEPKVKVGDWSGNALLYADDIAIVASSVQKMQVY